MEISVGIRELFGSLAVGILAILCFIYLYWLWFKKDSPKFIPWITKHSLIPSGNLGVLMMTILIILVGNITQDTTDHLTDSSSLWQTYYPLLQTEEEQRFFSLVNKTNKSYELNGLGKEVFRNRNLVESKIFNTNDVFLAEDPKGYFEEICSLNDFQIFINNIFGEEQEKICKLTEDRKYVEKNRLKSAKKFINLIYYQAKNWAYVPDKYYDLLRGIQIRIDLSRSLHLVSIIFLSILLIHCLFVLIIKKLPKIKIESQEQPNGENHQFSINIINNPHKIAVYKMDKPIFKKPIWIAIIVLFFLCWLTLLGYNHSEIMFNERVFGKYISHFDHSKISINKENNQAPNIINHAVWWVNKSLDYKVLTQEIYAMATRELESKKALDDKEWTASVEQPEAVKQANINLTSLKPAIIMDIDETVLDNSSYQRQLREMNAVHNDLSWDNCTQKQKATLVPGAKEFIEKAQELKIKILYVTNRKCNQSIRGSKEKCPQENDTIQNLQKQGITSNNGNVIPDEEILLRNERDNWEDDKSSRREYLASQYRVLMLIGDDLQDFVSKKELLNQEEFSQKYKDYLGKKWFFLPNPVYGSWTKRYQEIEK